MEETESNISQYLAEFDSADRQEPTAAKPKRMGSVSDLSSWN
jgi:hypothetical protein